MRHGVIMDSGILRVYSTENTDHFDKTEQSKSVCKQMMISLELFKFLQIFQLSIHSTTNAEKNAQM